MNIKAKRIKLTKALIGGSLLLSTLSLPLVLTSCSKKNNGGVTGKEKGDEAKHGYLFKLEPELFEKGSDEVIKKDNLILENDVKNLLNVEKGYDNNFFSNLDKSFGKNLEFYENDGDEKDENNDNNKFKKVDDLGETTVYYLNSSNITQTDQHISFAINKEIFGEFNKISDISKHITCRDIVIKKNLVVDTKNIEDGLVLVNNFYKKKGNASVGQHFSFFTGFNNEGINCFAKKDEEIDKIKKLKIVIHEDAEKESLGDGDGKNVGFLVTFTPIDNSTKKTIIFKYANDKDFNFFKKEFYENFEKDVVEKIVDKCNKDCAVKCAKISGKTFEEYVGEKLSYEFNDFYEFDGQAKKKYLKKFDEIHGLPNFDDLVEFMKDELGLILNLNHSINHHTYCFDFSSLPKKVGDDDIEYLFFIKNADELDKKIENTGKKDDIEFEISKNGGEVAKKGDFGSLNLPLSNFGDADEFIVKLAFKYKKNNFYSKDIAVIKAKK